MVIFPAIDILGGRAVRLLHGDRNKVTDYGSPLDFALRWQNEGAQYLHIVDLDGAFSGTQQNLETVKEILKNVSIPVQLGGGIRSLAAIENALSIGVSRVILGSALVFDKELIKCAAESFAGRLVAGIDARDGKVAVRGWVEMSTVCPYQLGKSLFDIGIDKVVFTDISRDGALSGVNADACAKMQSETGLSVIASGGVRSTDDIARLKELNVYGAILGRSLYTGDINLSNLI